MFFQKESAAATADKSAALPDRKMVYLLGEIRKPGEYPIAPGLDLVDTVVQAGGFTERADLNHIEVLYQDLDGKRSSLFSWKDFKKAPAPQHGDIIMVHADHVSQVERKTSLMTSIIGALASVVTATVIVLSYNRGRF
ncbi:MAG: SLBB domain-containing protein [Elusimicrobiota bacterium]